ncbi:MAG: response regulator [Acidobacteria bacterium]|nr:response regulator [Acidobacteriota bacterium]
MDRVKSYFSIKHADRDLASVRSSLLIIAQTGDVDDLSNPRRDLARLEKNARELGHTEIGDAALSAREALYNISSANAVEGAINALDLVSLIEATVWRLGGDDGTIDNVSDFVEASFDELRPADETSVDAPIDSWPAEEFDIDEETLDIFRSEADELLANIFNELEKLAASPADTNALWNIRRSSHTFKGAAGIEGMCEASSTAHRMEDLLDKMVELRVEASTDILEFLDASAMHLNSLVTAKNLDNDPNLDKHYDAAITSLASAASSKGTISQGNESQKATSNGRPDNSRPAPTPIVRVALDRLDDILTVSRNLIINRSALAERFSELDVLATLDSDTLAKVTAIFDAQRILTDELHAKLKQIRMVRFGTLETRLSRAVQMTAVDESKKATIEVENGDVEIDTQIIDALIEPLLHLLKNAVVHGIERADTRRLLGKPESGKVTVRIEADNEAVVVMISDDGSGISTAKLKQKAISARIITSDDAAEMNERDAFKLIFDRGLTTADKIDLNAGRGVGMSIVKESIESQGGSVHVESEPQKGTTFTLLLPVQNVQPIAVEPKKGPLIDAPALSPLVLIVDDSPSIRRQTQKIVAAAGLRTITANSGAEALELLLNGTVEPDLILSDVEMPHVDGWEMLEYIKTDDNFGHIPVVLVTSLDSEEHQTRAAELGASGYVIKPFGDKDLAYALDCLGMKVTA